LLEPPRQLKNTGEILTPGDNYHFLMDSIAEAPGYAESKEAGNSFLAAEAEGEEAIGLELNPCGDNFPEAEAESAEAPLFSLVVKSLAVVSAETTVSGDN